MSGPSIKSDISKAIEISESDPRYFDNIEADDDMTKDELARAYSIEASSERELRTKLTMAGRDKKTKTAP